MCQVFDVNLLMSCVNTPQSVPRIVCCHGRYVFYPGFLVDA